MIAAGEVVQRPASVVKELVENAVDAGADQVTVVIQDAGRTLIQVIDNGCGMSPDQAVLCFERHATSKLATAEDLHNILTFGFRGEALASIAAVAEVTLKTRREEDEVGCQVDFADSQHLATQEIATPRGANFSVRNLFYNVPARRKFLKKDSTEAMNVAALVERVALSRPDISIQLLIDGEEKFKTPGDNNLLNVFNSISTNHFSECCNSFSFEEHVLCTAKTDTFCTEFTSFLSICWSISICTNFKSSVFVSPCHNSAEFTSDFSVNCWDDTIIDVTC